MLLNNNRFLNLSYKLKFLFLLQEKSLMLKVKTHFFALKYCRLKPSQKALKIGNVLAYNLKVK